MASSRVSELQVWTEKGCVHGKTCFFRHVEAEENPNKRSQKGGAKGPVAILKSLHSWVVYLKIFIRERLFHANQGDWDRNTGKFSKGTWHQIEIRERKGPSRGIIQKCAPHERSLWAPKFGRRSYEETLHQEEVRPQSSVGSGEKNYKLKNSNRTPFYTPIEAKVKPAPA